MQRRSLRNSNGISLHAALLHNLDWEAHNKFASLNLKDLTANNEKYGNVWLGGAVVEVDAADDDHAEGDDHGDAAGDGAADGPQQQQDHLHHEVHHVPRGLVRVPDSAEQRVVGGRLS